MVRGQLFFRIDSLFGNSSATARVHASAGEGGLPVRTSSVARTATSPKFGIDFPPLLPSSGHKLVYSVTERAAVPIRSTRVLV